MDYKKQLSAMQLEKLKTVLDDMPSYCRDYLIIVTEHLIVQRQPCWNMHMTSGHISVL